MKSSYAFDAAAAVQKPAGPTTEDRSQTFRAVEGGTQLQSGEKLLVEAYAAIWVILFAMVLLSWRRQKQIDRRIDVLEGALEKARAGFDKGSS